MTLLQSAALIVSVRVPRRYPSMILYLTRVQVAPFLALHIRFVRVVILQFLRQILPGGSDVVLESR